MVEKKNTGFDLFDDRFGGCYAGRGMLLSGRARSGRTTFCLRFLQAGLEQGEKGLILTSGRAGDLLAQADGLGLPLRAALATQRLLFIEYARPTGSGADPRDPMLPPEGFVQLDEIIQTHGIRRMAIDTALPWITTPAGERVSERILSLVRAFDRLQLTTLYTLPRPASDPARRLFALFEQNVPICATLDFEPPEPSREFRVSKYLGAPLAPDPLPYEIGLRPPAGGATPQPAAPKLSGRTATGFAAAVQSSSAFLNPPARERTPS